MPTPEGLAAAQQLPDGYIRQRGDDLIAALPFSLPYEQALASQARAPELWLGLLLKTAEGEEQKYLVRVCEFGQLPDQPEIALVCTLAEDALPIFNAEKNGATLVLSKLGTRDEARRAIGYWG